MDKRGVAALAVLVLGALLATCQPQGQPLPRALALVRLHFRVRSDVSYTEFAHCETHADHSKHWAYTQLLVYTRRS